MVKIDEYVIDELVCGNLQGEEYRQVLRALEEQPEGWKTCALAFLQEQALSQELSAMAKNNNIWSEEFEQLHSTPTVECTPSISASRSSEKARLEWMTRITSIAALLLVSFSIGWFGAGLNNTSPSEGSNTGTIASNTTNVDEADTPSDVLDSSDMQYVSGDMIPLNRTRPQVLQRLESSGAFDVEAFEGFVPVQYSDGVRLVPVERYRVRSKVFPY